MQDRRLYYRVILKLLSATGMLILSIMFFRSLFVGNSMWGSYVESKDSEQVFVKIDGMKEGEIRKVFWMGKEVAVLRKARNEYFVYLNTGDSGNCPLFKESNGFKDVCTGTHFDFTGKQKGSNKEWGVRLRTPPHYFMDNILFIGEKFKN